MVTVVKSEWHQVEKRYGIEIDADTLSEIYPDLDEDEIQTKLDGLESGDEDIEEVINDAWENDVELDWDYLNDDDWWTDRKGGYDITYKVEEWEVREDYVSPVTHKCTKCKWEGSEFEADWVWPEDDETGEREAKKVCPMCESDTELTEIGVKEEQEKKERMTRAIHSMKEEEESEEEVPCYSCGAMHKESELPELSGQLHCPDCHEGWVMMDMREEEPVDENDLLEALEELKREFDALSATDEVVPMKSWELVPMKCTECDWMGDWTETASNDDEEDVCPRCAAHVEEIERAND
jgi:hypothetical protein